MSNSVSFGERCNDIFPWKQRLSLPAEQLSYVQGYSLLLSWLVALCGFNDRSRMGPTGRLNMWLQNSAGLLQRLINFITGIKISFKEFSIPSAAASGSAMELDWATAKAVPVSLIYSSFTCPCVGVPLFFH